MTEQENETKSSDAEGAFRRLPDEVRRYAIKRAELLSLEMNDRVSTIGTVTTLRISGIVMLLFAVCFLLFALAWYIGTLLESIPLGFVIVSGPFLLIGILLAALRPKRLVRKVHAQFFRKFMEMVSYIIFGASPGGGKGS